MTALDGVIWMAGAEGVVSMVSGEVSVRSVGPGASMVMQDIHAKLVKDASMESARTVAVLAVVAYTVMPVEVVLYAAAALMVAFGPLVFSATHVHTVTSEVIA